MIPTPQPGTKDDRIVWVVGLIIAVIGLGAIAFFHLENRIDIKFDGLDAKFDQIDAKLDTKFNQIYIKFDQIDAKFDRIQNQLQDLILAFANQPRQAPDIPDISDIK